MTDSTTLAILREIQSHGYAVSCIDGAAMGTGPVKYLAWLSDCVSVRPPDAEVLEGRGETRYQAAVPLCDAWGARCRAWRVVVSFEYA